MPFLPMGVPSRLLVDCAMGRVPADLIIHNGRWVCVQSGEIVPGTDIAVIAGRIAYVGPDAGHCLGPATQQIDAADRHLVPGLIDGHTHVESSMMSVTDFARAAMRWGTTAAMCDPHEMANVLGLPGVKAMVDEAAVQPIHVWMQMPSCIPSAPGFETPGSAVGPTEVATALQWPGIIGLGEVMDMAAVYRSDSKIHAEIAESQRAGKVIGGHFALADLGLPFHGYVAGGPEDDHEGTRLEDAIMRLRQGLKVMLRHRPGLSDMPELLKAVTERGLDPRHLILCTDGSPASALREGHLDRVVRDAIRAGLTAMTAIQTVTLNPAEHFGVARDVGQIASGRYADILLVGQLTDMDVQTVIAQGQVVAEHGRVATERPIFSYPDEFRRTVHLARPLTSDDFRLAAPGGAWAEAHVIGIVENQAPTRHLLCRVPVADGEVRMDVANDILKAAVIERHHGTGRIQIGLVNGFGFKVPCAAGTTLAHDCHHMVIVGSDEEHMASIANELARIGGGILVARAGEIRARLPLPIAGLLSDQPAEIVAEEMTRVLDELRACGCPMQNSVVQLCLLALVVIPSLRLSDLGLVDAENYRILPVLAG